jgi:hypothetical protein
VEVQDFSQPEDDDDDEGSNIEHKKPFHAHTEQAIQSSAKNRELETTTPMTHPATDPASKLTCIANAIGSNRTEEKSSHCVEQRTSEVLTKTV